jgi:hypothetical protein
MAHEPILITFSGHVSVEELLAKKHSCHLTSLSLNGNCSCSGRKPVSRQGGNNEQRFAHAIFPKVLIPTPLPRISGRER